MLPWLWMQMRLCDVVYRMREDTAPEHRRKAVICMMCVCLSRRVHEKEETNEVAGARKGVNPLWNTGERAATGSCFSVWYCYLFYSHGQESKQRRGCVEIFSAQLQRSSGKMSSSIRPRCEKRKKRVFSPNHCRESVNSTGRCVQFELRLVII